MTQPHIMNVKNNNQPYKTIKQHAKWTKKEEHKIRAHKRTKKTKHKQQQQTLIKQNSQDNQSNKQQKTKKHNA